MKEHPILFSAPMVLALLADRKSVTRRLSKQWLKRKAGDRLWVKETWTFINMSSEPRPEVCIAYNADGDNLPFRPCIAVTEADLTRLWDRKRDIWQHRKQPSIFMFRWASRILLECEEDARVERLRDITEEEALMEGAEELCDHCGQPPEHEVHWACEADYEPEISRRVGFMRLWQSLHTKPGERWDDNPEVVRVGRFRRIA